jgi:hypothetical protein
MPLSTSDDPACSPSHDILLAVAASLLGTRLDLSGVAVEARCSWNE